MTVHPSSANVVRAVARESFAPVPPDAFPSVAARRAAGDRVILPTAAVTPKRRLRKRWMVTLLLGVASAAAALPGSPVRHVITALFTARPANPQQNVAAPSRAAVTPPTIAVVDTPEAGVTIPSRDRPLWVALDTLTSRVRVVLRIVDRHELEVRGLAAAANATFRPREDGISVTQLRGGDLRIDVPRQAPVFSLLVRGVEVASAASGRFRSGRADSLVVIARP